MKEQSGLKFKFIKDSKSVEVWSMDKLERVIDIDESEKLLTALFKANTNLIDCTNRSRWQRHVRRLLPSRIKHRNKLFF